MRERGIIPTATSDVITLQDRKQIYFRALEWSNHWLDELDLDEEHIFFKTGFTIKDLARTNIYMFFDHIIYLITLLESGIKKYSPQVLILPNNSYPKVRGVDHTNEYYLSYLGKLLAKKYNIDLFEVESAPKDLSFNKKLDTDDRFSVAANNNKPTINKRKFFLNVIMRIIDSFVNKHLINSNGELTRQIQDSLLNKQILIFGGGVSSPFWRLENFIDFMAGSTECKFIPIYYLNDKYDFKKEGIYIGQERDNIESYDEFEKLNNFIKPVIESNGWI